MRKCIRFFGQSGVMQKLRMMLILCHALFQMRTSIIFVILFRVEYWYSHLVVNSAFLFACYHCVVVALYEPKCFFWRIQFVKQDMNFLYLLLFLMTTSFLQHFLALQAQSSFEIIHTNLWNQDNNLKFSLSLGNCFLENGFPHFWTVWTNLFIMSNGLGFIFLGSATATTSFNVKWCVKLGQKNFDWAWVILRQAWNVKSKLRGDGTFWQTKN